MLTRTTIEHRAWDSHWLGINVFQIRAAAADAECLKAIDKCRSAGASLIYIIGPENGRPSWLPAGTKIFLTRPAVSTHEDRRHELAPYMTDDEKVIQPLIRQASAVSRFNLDPNISPVLIEEMYRRWILTGSEVSVHVARHKGNPKPQSLLAYRKTYERLGYSIEVLVSEGSCRRLGLASALVNRLAAPHTGSQPAIISVCALKENAAACHFYNRLGFKQEGQEKYWHLWI